MKVLSYNIYGVKDTKYPIPEFDIRQKNLYKNVNKILSDDEIKVLCFQEVNENNMELLEQILRENNFICLNKFPMKTESINQYNIVAVKNDSSIKVIDIFCLPHGKDESYKDINEQNIDYDMSDYRTTVFVLFKGIVSAATNKGEKAFKYAIPKNAFRKAAVVTVLGINVVLIGTFLISIFEPQLELRDILFEVVSAYGTVGLTTGITTSLSAASKILSMIIMFIGRLGPMTIVTLWYFSRGERISYPEGNISIG